jgi:hypothetical protein
LAANEGARACAVEIEIANSKFFPSIFKVGGSATVYGASESVLGAISDFNCFFKCGRVHAGEYWATDLFACKSVLRFNTGKDVRGNKGFASYLSEPVWNRRGGSKRAFLAADGDIGADLQRARLFGPQIDR